MLLKKLVSLILSLMILFVCFIPFQTVEASVLGATAVTIGGVAISSTALAVGTAVLVAGGLVFATNEHARTATINYFRNAGSHVIDFFNGCKLVTDATWGTLAQIGDDIWSSAKDWISNTFTPGDNTVTTTGQYVDINGNLYVVYDSIPNYNQMTPAILGPDGITYSVDVVDYTDQNYKYLWLVRDGVRASNYIQLVSTPQSTDMRLALVYSDVYKKNIGVYCKYVSNGGGYATTSSLATVYTNIQPEQKYPASYSASADNSITDTGRDYVTVPNNRGVCVDVDGNYSGLTSQDTAIDYDFESGGVVEPIDDYGLIGSIGQWLNGINTWLTTDFLTGVGDITAGITGTLTGVIDGVGSFVTSISTAISTAFTDFFKVDTLDFDGLKNLVVYDKFPFSIPFDFVEAVKMFGVSAQTPVFEIDIDTEFLQIHHTIDLSPYQFYIAFFRYFVVVSFIFILIFATSKFIQW